MAKIISLPCTEHVKDIYIQAIVGTRQFFCFVNRATDPAVKQQWIRTGLLDENYADSLLIRIKNTPEGETLNFSLDEMIQMITAIDICSKFYLNPLFIKVEKAICNMFPDLTPEQMKAGNNYMLKCFQSMITELKTLMKGNVKFKKAISQLNKIEITDFKMPSDN